LRSWFAIWFANGAGGQSAFGGRADIPNQPPDVS
jgi:hypothetical protein